MKLPALPGGLSRGPDAHRKGGADASRPEARVNGKKVPLDSPAILTNGRVMVPLRFLSEVMDFEVKWYAGQKVIEILK